MEPSFPAWIWNVQMLTSMATINGDPVAANLSAHIFANANCQGCCGGEGEGTLLRCCGGELLPQSGNAHRLLSERHCFGLRRSSVRLCHGDRCRHWRAVGYLLWDKSVPAPLCAVVAGRDGPGGERARWRSNRGCCDCDHGSLCERSSPAYIHHHVQQIVAIVVGNVAVSQPTRRGTQALAQGPSLRAHPPVP